MKLYYIQDARHVVGNCTLWWAIDANGYTCDLDKAGLFDEEFIKTLRENTDIPYPQKAVERAVVRHVRIESLRQIKG